LAIGTIVCVPWKNKGYVRGEIKMLQSEKRIAMVFLSDIGSIVQYPVGSLCKANNEIVEVN